MNSTGLPRAAAGRALISLFALTFVALFMACGTADRLMGPSHGGPLLATGAGPTSPATGVVISQVYGGGGNSGATITNDFVELYNGGTTAADVTGWSVQYASATGSTWQVTTLSGTILPGHHYLVQEATGTGGTVSLPTPDASGSIPMSATAGKVALVTTATALTGTCPTSFKDLVGFGTTANCFRGSGPTPAPSNTNAVLRAFDGQQDSNNNAADFATGAPNPRNSASPPVTPIDALKASIAPTRPSIATGATQTFTATATKSSALVTVTSAAWTSSNTTVATINPSNGVATSVAAGTTVIGVIVTTAQGTATDTTTLTVTSSTPPAPSAVVISQVYGGGGNAGATLKYDYIELYNGGTTPVSLDGWSVQYGGSSGGGWSATNKTDLSGTIQPGHYFLVQEAAGNNAGAADLPVTPDQIGSIAMGAGSGQVALTRSTAVLSGACPVADPVIIDYVGYGSVACFKGAASTAALSNTTAALRKDFGRTNSNDNAADFDVGAPTPRNSADTPPILGPAATVAIAPSSASVIVGKTTSLAATAKDAEGHTVIATFTWTTDNAAVATVSSTGVVTGKAIGSTTIHATTADGKVGDATVTVTPVTGTIAVQARTNPLPKGFQTQLFLNSGGTDATGAPVGNSDVIWSSAAPSIVSVNSVTGVITANGVGQVAITATANSDGVTTSATTITVTDPPVAADARKGHNTELGVPTDADPIDDLIIARRQYTTSYNPRRGVTNWVSWNLDASHRGGVVRCNCMTADTALVRLGLPAYDTNDWINDGSNGQYSRGHMSPSADWQVSDGDNAVTFFLTNMLPQNQPMNGGPWGEFENYLRTRAVGTTQIYIVSGGIFTPNRRDAGVDGFGTISNRGKIAIPDSIWKVAVIVPDSRAASDIGSPADVEVIAINTPNENPAPGATYATYFTTIDKIQRSTGYDLLSTFPEGIQCKLEVRNCVPSALITGAGLAGGSEGQTLAFDASGSTDADAADALTYSWSIDGTVVGSGATLNHTFTRHGPYVLRLTVSDGHGGTAVVTSTIAIANVAPSVAAFTGGSIDEGGAWSTTGAFADPGDEAWTATADYGDGSGAQPLALEGKSFALAHTYANNGQYTVTVTVTETDVEAASGTGTTLVTVANVAPVVADFDGATILRGETYTSAGTFADPGADAWTATVNYGDGSGSTTLVLSGKSFALRHAFTAAGTRTVTVTVADGDGGSGVRTAQVRVLSPKEGVGELSATIRALSSAGRVDDGDAKWLLNKLDVASKQLDKGNLGPARNQLDQIIGRIEAARRAGRLSAADAASLTAYANRVLASIV